MRAAAMAWSPVQQVGLQRRSARLVALPLHRSVERTPCGPIPLIPRLSSAARLFSIEGQAEDRAPKTPCGRYGFPAAPAPPFDFPGFRSFCSGGRPSSKKRARDGIQHVPPNLAESCTTPPPSPSTPSAPRVMVQHVRMATLNLALSHPGAKYSHRAAMSAAQHIFQFAQYLHGADLERANHRAARKRGPQDIGHTQHQRRFLRGAR